MINGEKHGCIFDKGSEAASIGKGILEELPLDLI